MKLYYFSEMPHHEFPDEEGAKYPSLRLDFPNRFFSPEKARANYQRYLDEYEFAEALRFVADAPDAARAIAKPGRDYVLANYTWDRVLDALEPTLEEWLCGS